MVKSKHNFEVVVDFKMAAMYNEYNERQPIDTKKITD